MVVTASTCRRMYTNCTHKQTVKKLYLSTLSCISMILGTIWPPEYFLGCMQTSQHEHAFRITGPLWGESTGSRWILFTKGSVRRRFSWLLAWTSCWTDGWYTDYLKRSCDSNYKPRNISFFLFLIVRTKVNSVSIFKFASSTIRQANHYSDGIMSAMASQITSVSIVCPTVCSGADQRKLQSSASLAFVKGIHRWPEISLIKASNAENVHIWWRHHDCPILKNGVKFTHPWDMLKNTFENSKQWDKWVFQICLSARNLLTKNARNAFIWPFLSECWINYENPQV